MNELTFESIKHNPEVNAYIAAADEIMVAIGYTEHSFAHVARVAEVAKYILEQLGYTARDIELAQVAAWLHDMGNLVNRVNHAQSSALLTHSILSRMDVPYADIASVVSAIGHHDESVAEPVTPIAAALIIADKADVRRSRVRRAKSPQDGTAAFDMHDRVNFSAKHSCVRIDSEQRALWLEIEIDTHYSSVMEFFEAFLNRMVLCRRACEKLGLIFRLGINDTELL